MAKKDPVKNYLKSVQRRLRLPKDIRLRVMADFAGAVESRREAGKTDEEIFAELGSPKEAAMQLNEQMKEYAWKKSPWRWLCLAAAAVSALALLIGLFQWLTVVDFVGSNAASIGIIGGADGPTAVFVASPSHSSLFKWCAAGLIFVLGTLGFALLGRVRKK